MVAAQSTMPRTGMHLINTRKAAIASELAASKSTSIDGDRSTVLGRDFLSVLIRSNLATAAPPAAQLSSNETLCQISVYIAAGFDTTCSALSWPLFALSRAPGAQYRRRRRVGCVGLRARHAALPRLDGPRGAAPARAHHEHHARLRPSAFPPSRTGAGT